MSKDPVANSIAATKQQASEQPSPTTTPTPVPQEPAWPAIKAFLRDREQRDRPTSHLRADLQRLNAANWPDTAENLIQQFDAGFEELLVKSGGNRPDPSLLEDQAKAKMRIGGSGGRSDPTAEQGADGVKVAALKAELVKIAKRHRIPGDWLEAAEAGKPSQQEPRCAACSHEYRELIDDELRCGMSTRGLQGKLADMLASPISHETIRKHRLHTIVAKREAVS